MAKRGELGATSKRFFDEGDTNDAAELEAMLDSWLKIFMKDERVNSAASISELESLFNTACIPNEGLGLADYAEHTLRPLVEHSNRVGAPGFIGHMTGPLPWELQLVSRLVTGLNQNTVKAETAKLATVLERQALGMLHDLVYGSQIHAADGECSESEGLGTNAPSVVVDEAKRSFYGQHLHDSESALGGFCADGTLANLTALWVARNNALAPKGDFQGIAQDGIAAGLAAHGYSRMVLIGSERLHYSLAKSIDVLGIGRRNVELIPVTDESRIDLDALRSQCETLTAEGACILAIVGVAGATETGRVDSLEEMADIAQCYGAHFHVDAAWGGPTLMSPRYCSILKGIERADSVTLDGHKQMYAPMSVGMVLFRDPLALASVQHHASYILRAGSKDLGRYSLEGSRPAASIGIHAVLNLMGRQGFAELVDDNIERAKRFAQMIEQRENFELVTAPELNILTYRYVPHRIQSTLKNAGESGRAHINGVLSKVTAELHRSQTSNGEFFVSRTTFRHPRYALEPITVFRVILANPNTSDELLSAVLDDQEVRAGLTPVQALLDAA